MQRLIPYGRTYAESPEFSVDEGSEVTVWLVREDQTSTVGESKAFIEVKSVDGQWTEVATLSYAQPSFTIRGADDAAVYRVIRRAQSWRAAVDSSLPALNAVQSQTLQASSLTGDWTAGECIAAKFVAAADPNSPGTYGFLYSKTPDANSFGTLLDPIPVGDWDDFGLRMQVGDPAELIYDPPVATPGLSGYNGGTIRIHDATGAVLATYQATASNTNIDIELPANSIALVAGETYYVTICHPDDEFSFAVTLTGEGRFTLDQNDIPARLSANILNAGETVTLYAVEGPNGEVVVPITFPDGSPVELDSQYMVHTITAPGTYEWRRSSGSDAGIYLNTGWIP